MDRGLLLIFVLTFVIHLIGTLAYSVRIAGTRTRRIAISLSLFNILVACNNEIATDPNSPVHIRVGPLYWFRALVGFSNVAHEFSTQVVGRAKDASGDNVSLDLVKPQFYLIEPR